MIKFIYALLIIGLIIANVMFFRKLLETMKIAAGLKPSIESLSENASEAKEKIAKIEETKDSWQFFVAIYVIFIILKETFRDRKNEKTGIAFSKACVRHASQLKAIKL